MKKIFLILTFCGIAGQLFGQSDYQFFFDKEGKMFVLPRIKNYELKIPEIKMESYTPASTLRLDIQLNSFTPEFTQTLFDERPMDMQILSEAYRPFFNVFAPMLRKVSPMAFDFHETKVVPLTDNSTFLISGHQYTWPGAGGFTSIVPAYAWQSGNWTLTGGGFAGRFYTPFNASPAYNAGANVGARFEINDRMAIRGWGQYTHYFGEEKNNPHMLMNPFFYHTGAGGAFEFKFNDDFGVGVGVNYEYNPRRRRMEPQYLIYPVFNSKTIQIRVN
ncbi:hypothetical protein LJB97_00565 [Parabacteroides sp. OttesenSCG-928-O15]|nr:hypothetical protein [Parabacteroides sp. OttesenSCG-928-O15]